MTLCGLKKIIYADVFWATKVLPLHFFFFSKLASYLRAIKCSVNQLSFFITIKLKSVFQRILRASRNVPLVKEAKFAKTFVCLQSRLAFFSVPTCETTLHFSVSQRRTFVMPPKNFWHNNRQRMWFKVVFVSCWNSMYQLFFSMVKLGQICLFWKEPKSCFSLRPTQPHLSSLSKDNCWIIKCKSVFALWLDFI